MPIVVRWISGGRDVRGMMVFEQQDGEGVEDRFLDSVVGSPQVTVKLTALIRIGKLKVLDDAGSVHSEVKAAMSCVF